MMIILGLGAALLIIFAAGLGVTLIAARGQRSVNLPEILALSWFFGTGLISLLVWVGGFLFSGLLLQAFVTVISLGLGTIGLYLVRRNGMRASVPVPRRPIEWILIAAVAAQFVAMFYLSFSYGLGWDGLLNFEIKARYAFLNHGVIPAAYFSDTTRDFTHQAYPPWIPLTELWLYLWMGAAHQFWLKLLFAPFYVAGVILLAILGKRLTGRRWIGLLTAALLFFVPCLTTMPGGVQVGYVDTPISMLYLAAIGYLLCAAEKTEPFYWRIFALSLALLPWAKREGAILWLIAAVCGVFVLWQTRRSPRALFWLLPGFIIMIAWKAFYSTMGKTELFEYLPMTFSTLMKNLPRIGPIARGLGTLMIDTVEWSILWPLALIAFVTLFWRRFDRRVLVLFVAVSGPITIYAAMYIFSGWPDWMAHIEQSFSRLLLHVVPVVWLALALALRPPAVRPETSEL